MGEHKRSRRVAALLVLPSKTFPRKGQTSNTYQDPWFDLGQRMPAARGSFDLVQDPAMWDGRELLLVLGLCRV